MLTLLLNFSGDAFSKDQLVVNHAPRARFNREDELLLAVGRGRCQPHAPVADRRSRKAKPLEVDLPGNVLAGGLIPLNRHAAGVAFVGAAVVQRTVPTRPGELGRRQRAQHKDERQQTGDRNQSQDVHGGLIDERPRWRRWFSERRPNGTR